MIRGKHWGGLFIVGIGHGVKETQPMENGRTNYPPRHLYWMNGVRSVKIEIGTKRLTFSFLS